MTTVTVTAIKIHNNFGRYLSMVMNENKIIATKNEKKSGGLYQDTVVLYFTDI